jgi:hypothetical protein
LGFSGFGFGAKGDGGQQQQNSNVSQKFHTSSMDRQGILFMGNLMGWKNAIRGVAVFSTPRRVATKGGFMMKTMERMKNRMFREGEGPVGRAVEQYAEKVPSDLFFWAAAGSIAASLALKVAKRDEEALFVGQWAPTFLLLGLFNKLVKSISSEHEA